MMKRYALGTVFIICSSCFLAPKKKPVVADQSQVTVEEQTDPVQAETPASVEVPFPDVKPTPGETAADHTRKLQDTKIPALVDQKVEEIKKAASEGYRVYTETTTNGIRATKMADEFQKRGFKVKVLKLTNSETYQLVITW